MARSILLEAKDLAYGIVGGPLLAEGVSFRAASGGVLLITGPNGSGKSTLLRTLLGRQRPRRGRIEWNIPREKIGFLPQMQDSEAHLPFTLRDILATNAGKMPFQEERALALGLLEKRHLKLEWNRASGGERKRALLTRIFLAEPAALALDEPFNHLDHESRTLIVGALRDYLSAPGHERFAIVVSHESLLERGLADLPIAKVNL